MGELNEGTIKEQESNILDYPKSNLIHTCNKRQRNPVEACAWYFDKEYQYVFSNFFAWLITVENFYSFFKKFLLNLYPPFI